MIRIGVSELDRGGVLTELAILIPLIILMTGGLIDLGKMIRESNVLVEASRHGARSGGALVNAQVNWCTGSVADLVDVPCSPIPRHGTPLQTSVARSCDYIESAGLSRADWQVSVSRSLMADEDLALPITVFGLRVQIGQNPASNSRCLLCWLPFLKSWLLSAESIFPAQIRC